MEELDGPEERRKTIERKTNKEKILEYLLSQKENIFECDTCIGEKLNIFPRQKVNCITNELERCGKVVRYKTKCNSCSNLRLVNKIKNKLCEKRY